MDHASAQTSELGNEDPKMRTVAIRQQNDGCFPIWNEFMGASGQLNRLKLCVNIFWDKAWVEFPHTGETELSQGRGNTAFGHLR